jgi:hypothetical protein
MVVGTAEVAAQSAVVAKQLDTRHFNNVLDGTKTAEGRPAEKIAE